MKLFPGTRKKSQQAQSAKLPVSCRAISRNLIVVFGGAILLLTGGAGYVDSGSNTTLLFPVGMAHAAQIVPPNSSYTTVETASQNTLVSGVAKPSSGSTPEKISLPANVQPIKNNRRLSRVNATTDDKAISQFGKMRLISIVQQQAEPVDPQLMAAYFAYRNGKLGEARQLYLSLFRKDAHNPDVLLGLAVIAQQNGESLLAEQYFAQVLVLDPRNAAANAGMSALNAGDDSSESRLKSLLREQKNSAVLHFALGNIYADQLRWSEAQQVYFNAYLLEPDNVGFAFNLAVSLEHLGQNGLAVQHYRRALQLDQSQSGYFDHAQVSQHIETLSRYENAD